VSEIGLLCLGSIDSIVRIVRWAMSSLIWTPVNSLLCCVLTIYMSSDVCFNGVIDAAAYSFRSSNLFLAANTTNQSITTHETCTARTGFNNSYCFCSSTPMPRIISVADGGGIRGRPAACRRQQFVKQQSKQNQHQRRVREKVAGDIKSMSKGMLALQGLNEAEQIKRSRT